MLRDALAAALGRLNGWDKAQPADEREAAFILSDPAFREALVEAVAEALNAMAGEDPEDFDGPCLHDAGDFAPSSELVMASDLAGAIVARILGEAK